MIQKAPVTLDESEIDRMVQEDIAGIVKVRNPRETPEVSPPSAAGEPPSSEPSAAVPNPHDVFRQMGLNMENARSYQLGEIELRSRFDAFDNAIERERRQSQRPETAVWQKTISHEENDQSEVSPELQGDEIEAELLKIKLATKAGAGAYEADKKAGPDAEQIPAATPESPAQDKDGPILEEDRVSPADAPASAQPELQTSIEHPSTSDSGSTHDSVESAKHLPEEFESPGSKN